MICSACKEHCQAELLDDGVASDCCGASVIYEGRYMTTTDYHYELGCEKADDYVSDRQ